MIPKIIHFMRVDKDGTYHDFSLIHYLSIRSFAIQNPEVQIKFWTNVEPTSFWYTLMKKETKNLKVEILKSLKWDSYDNINHLVDHERLKILYKEGGIALDLDFICIESIMDLFNKDCIISEERDPLSHKFLQLAIGIVGCCKEHPFINEWMKAYDNYEKGKDWTEYSGKLPTELYKHYSNSVYVIPEAFINPFTFDRDSLAHLFLHNRDMCHAWMFHVSESIAWDRYLKPLDLEHIMTVDTTFTRYVREYVCHLWNSEKNQSYIRV